MLDMTIQKLVNAMDYYYKDNVVCGVNQEDTGSNHIIQVDFSLDSVKCTMTDGTISIDATLYVVDRACKVYICGYHDTDDTSKIDEVIKSICDNDEVLSHDSNIEVEVQIIKKTN